MKPFLRLLTATALFASAHLAFSQAADSTTVEKEKAKLPDAIRKIAEKGDSAGEPSNDAPKKTTTTKSSGKKSSSSSSTKKSNTEDPAHWGPKEVHKLAVMEVSLSGRTETVMFELYPNSAPLTVANFIENCTANAYKGVAFHRAIDKYLVQTGDPLTADDSKRNQWGTGGEDKTIPGEFKLPHTGGAVAMARRDDSVNPERRSNGYQFYFALGNLSALNSTYTVFGQVVSGMDILQEIAKAPVDSNDCPLQRIEVKSLKVADHKGPLVVMRTVGVGRKRFTTPSSAKGSLTRLLERIW
ncbi:MAG: rotA [Verrucomicrobiaceae bacterium]|nr:rotA [Verrucomicrobiaceae bacterium]